MLFIDEAVICVRSGKGGDGCVSFRREKYVPKGGPDGGDGGDGGSVYIEVDPQLSTLADFKGVEFWVAKPGHPGAARNCSGRMGQDKLIPVPAGTIVRDRDTGVVLKDLTEPYERLCVAAGGKGGRGNARFASPTHQAPRKFEPGAPGEERWLKLELKLIADVGVIGLPNAGKSTLLSRVTKAKPKIADYPFTTLVPNLGIVELSGFRRFVMADVPGLIEGAHEGTGLGDTFLKHIERTRVLVHLVDLYPPEGQEEPVSAYRTIRHELEQYSPKLAAKPELVVASKLDLVGQLNPPELAEFAAGIGVDAVGISAVSGLGLESVMERIWKMLEAHKAEETEDDLL